MLKPRQKLDNQVLLKAKYCQQVMPAQHFVNPGGLCIQGAAEKSSPLKFFGVF